MRSKELREQQRLELESEECTFRPSFGGGGGGGSGRSRRSSSADSRTRGRRASRASSTTSSAAAARRESAGVGPAAAEAFAAREAAFQVSKQQRLEALRKEKEALELQEATFQPVIGAEGRRASAAGGGGSSNGGGASSTAPGVAGGGLSSASQAKAAERKDSVGFKVSPACLISLRRRVGVL